MIKAKKNFKFPPPREGSPLTEKQFHKVLSNPFYCVTADPMFTQEHEFLVSEDKWVGANVNLIKDIGAEEWLRCLLENLKGDFV